MELLKHCHLCPRACGADRSLSGGRGFCGGSKLPKLARAALHFWEEPVISGEEGSGTVFFSGCPLQCIFCQNHNISSGNFGEEISIERLAAIFLELQEQGANNINLVTGSHYVPQIIEALDLVKGQLHIPVVFNSSGYETVETLKLLDGYVDIYLPDLKYMSNERAVRYSNAKDYVERATSAILEMYRQVGPVQYDERGMLTKGLIVRHLVLPNGIEDSAAVLNWVAEHLPLDDILVSIMSQYTPFHRSSNFPEIHRRLTEEEYEAVLDILDELEIENGFCQELSSATEEYTPSFRLEGVLKKEEKPMKATIQQVIDRFIDDYCVKEGWERIWQSALVGIADANDPSFPELRKLIIEDHQLPQEALPSAKNVISYFLPFIPEIPQSNVAGDMPSEPWGDAYKKTNKMAADLNTHLIQWIMDQGCEAANPNAVMLGEPYLRSRWSQRHVARIAGLGSFGVNNMLLTEKGCCGRAYSIVTSMDLPVDKPCEEEYCLYKKNGSCLLCVKHCPISALTAEGFDRLKCHLHLEDNGKHLTSGSTVCGKCLVGLPCSFKRP